MADSAPSPDVQAPPPLPLPSGLTYGPALARTAPERLGMTFDTRMLLALSSSFLCGFTLGASHSGHLASMRFRAENAHRLPISQPGWYLYHKSKNYYKWKEGIAVGLRRGAHLAAWTSVFFVIEESMDVFRGTWRAGRTLAEMEGVDELDMRDMHKSVGLQRDFWSSAGAGMVTGGLWSAWNGFSMVTAARTIRLGLLVGAGYGLAQDGLMWAKRKYGLDEGESWTYTGAKNRMKKEGGHAEQVAPE